MNDKKLIGFKDGMAVYVTAALLAEKGEREVREQFGLIRRYPVITDLSGHEVMVEGDSHEDAVRRYFMKDQKMMTTHDVLEEWEKWSYSTGLDERNHDLCDALKAIRASTDATEATLKQVLALVQMYLPPGGITKDELINRIIACVDPWPTGTPSLPDNAEVSGAGTASAGLPSYASGDEK